MAAWADPAAFSPTLPVELQAALDLVVQHAAANQPGAGPAVGDPALLAVLQAYGWTNNRSPAPLIALLPHPDALRVALAQAPDHVLIVMPGPIALVLSPFRRAATRFPAGLSDKEWRSRGYKRTWRAGIQGPGCLWWLAAGRLADAVGRPDLADRCRVGMLRSLVTSPLGRRLAAVGIDEWQRERT